MKCPCCATGFKVEDQGPNVVCMSGHKFHVEMNREDQSLNLELVDDPNHNAGVKIGEVFNLHQSAAA